LCVFSAAHRAYAVGENWAKDRHDDDRGVCVQKHADDEQQDVNQEQQDQRVSDIQLDDTIGQPHRMWQ
jgi:hypothetical protein